MQNKILIGMKKPLFKVSFQIEIENLKRDLEQLFLDSN